ncbi:ankyrin repeat protein [Acanthamoeba castellanii medusavirus]|uniref:Ankyrin repeat protein n=1 Tax=Acanthamoeba castellanii medusavirus J1 TaxID=3114988 RepID=A0A3T1CWT6_9VIRU|nr:ankyrin repeat protein [Acanthamoeba castellanii medusavirus]BBI30297.1 ankyrin repeat protein [Acanthamoeba castellanii medusavirus J1]
MLRDEEVQRCIEAANEEDWATVTVLLKELGSWSYNLFEQAIKDGHLPIIKHLISYGIGFPCRSCEKAIAGGQLEVLKLLCSHGCKPEEDYAVNQAAAAGSTDVLQWLVEEKRLPVTSYAYTSAAEEGHLAVLEWLHQRDYPWEKSCVDGAVKRGQLAVLEWFDALGCPWTAEHCAAAAREGHLAVVRWLMTRGCPMDASACIAAAHNGHLEILQCLADHGCPMDNAACIAAARRGGRPEVVAWLRRHEDPAVLAAERQEIETVAASRKRARESLDRHDAAIAEHKESIKRIKVEAAEERACSRLFDVLEPILTGETRSMDWWNDKLGSGPECPSWFFFDGMDDAAIAIILGKPCALLDSEVQSLMRRRLRIVDREAQLVVPVTSEYYANSDYEDSARIHSDDDWKVVLSDGSERSECNLAIDSGKALDKWLRKNGDEGDREYDGDSDGHRYTTTITVSGLLIDVTPVV